MLVFTKPLRAFVISFLVCGFTAALGCRGQVPAVRSDAQLSPELTRRIEVLIRQRSNIPANYSIVVGPKTKSDMPNFDQVEVTFTDGQKSSRPVSFLLSMDGKTLAQFSKYDISQDPKTLVSAADRPARGGPASAPVTIVLFDDLECPFCAKMHAQLFPALQDRYRDQVHIVYRDYPLDQHPWALRAAIDSNCLASQSATGYWNLVDYVHLHADELGGKDKSLAQANDTLDKLTLDEGKRQKADETKMAACVKKQDASPIDASKHMAEALGVDSTPALFINGEKLDGAQPIEYVFRMIDNALIAEGKTPPAPLPSTTPAVPSTIPAAPSTTPAAATGQNKGGN